MINLFFVRKINLISPMPLSELRNLMTDVLQNQRKVFFGDSCEGQFTSERRFELHYWSSFVYIKWFENKAAYISGELTEESDHTIVNLTIRPNSIFVFTFYIFSAIWLYFIFLAASNEKNRVLMLLIPPVSLTIFGGLISFLTYYAGRKIRKIFNLQDVEKTG